MKKHNEFCEGHVMCPTTGKEECGKVMVSKVYLDHEEAAVIFCFGCGETHNVKEEAENQ
jgi:hypothetical protein